MSEPSPRTGRARDGSRAVASGRADGRARRRARRRRRAVRGALGLPAVAVLALALPCCARPTGGASPIRPRRSGADQRLAAAQQHARPPSGAVITHRRRPRRPAVNPAHADHGHGRRRHADLGQAASTPTASRSRARCRRTAPPGRTPRTSATARPTRSPPPRRTRDGVASTKNATFTTLTPNNMTMPYLQHTGGYALRERRHLRRRHRPGRPLRRGDHRQGAPPRRR